MFRKLFSTGVVSSLLWLYIAAPVTALSKPGEPVQLKVPDTTLTLRGYAAPAALVTFKDNGSVVGTLAANASGYFSYNLSSQSPGIHPFTAQFEDSNGLNSAALKKSVSLQVQANTILELFLSPTIERRTSKQLQQGSLVQVNGYSAAGAKVSLQLAETGEVLTVIADGDGFYEFLIDTDDLEVGTYTASVASTVTGYSMTSARSNNIGFTVFSKQSSNPGTTPKTTGPDIVVSPQQLPPPTPESPEDGAVIEGDSVTITGESVPNAQIIIYENGAVIGSVFADNNGKWSFDYQATSSPVTLSFEACINGRCSVLSKKITLIFSLISDCRIVFELEQYRFWNHPVGDVLELDVFLTGGDGVAKVNWGDTGIDEVFDHSARRPVPLKHAYDRTGRYNGSVIFTQDECSYTRYFSVDVVDNENNSKLNVWIAMLLVGALLPFSTAAYEKGKKLKPEN